MLAIAPSPRSTSAPLHAGRPLDAGTFAAIRRRAVLECCKWDPQVGDVSTLAPFPLVVRPDVWRRLAGWAERLAAETVAAEAELFCRPRLHRRLGVPWRIRRVLQSASQQGLTPGALRILRFDFHPTTDGWRVSEVNSDVPGGFTESSSFTRMMAECCGLAPSGDPTTAWLDAMCAVAGHGSVLGLLSAPGYMEDLQIMAYLAGRLRERSCRAVLASPRQLRWRDGRAFLAAKSHDGPVTALVRFYQAEWLPRLPRRCGWEHFFCGGRTPVVNPGVAVLTESKRFPLVWDALPTPLPAWRALLPETRDPRDAPWRTDDSWLLKSAYCNNGDTVTHPSLVEPKERKGVWREVFWQPGHWVAQRRFETVALDTPLGRAYPCVGVYTVNGKAAGAYARIARHPLINYAAVDVAVLVDSERGSP